MLGYSRKISHGLIFISVLLTFHHVDARSVKPVTFGYEIGRPFGDLLAPVVSNEDLDLTISAAEPRPVFVELVKRPLSLPLVADVGAISAPSAAPVISASEKIEKILRRPMAFSYNTDQANAASHLIINSPKEKLETVESKLRLDQQPDAIDYYKYIARLEQEEKDAGAAVQKENVEVKKEETNQKQETSKEEKKDNADLRAKSKPNIFLSYSPSNFHHEYSNSDDHKPLLHYTKAPEATPKHKSEEIKEESQKSKSEDHGNHGDHHPHPFHHHHHHQHHEAQPVVDLGGKGAASESHEEHKVESHHSDQQQGGHSDSHESATDDGHKQGEVQASASHHGGDGGGGGGGNFKKGGGKEYQSVNQGEHGEHGEKKYSGHHHHEKGEKGLKDKDVHINEYEEDEGKKDGHHEEDGYEAEHHHGEEGKRGTEFHEEGEHSKGHSTQGEHNIHKKDEFEKKHEFYDESHEGGEHEKHGEYFHEDDYHKGGHHKSEHKKGGEHEEHYGKKKQFEEGGHEHEDKGHKKAVGRDVHHDVHEEEGSAGKQQGGKKWEYKHGENSGGDDNKGAHQHVLVVVKDGKAEASNNGKAEDSKGADYHVHEIRQEKKPEGEQGGEAQASEDHSDDHHDPYARIDHEDDDAEHHYQEVRAHSAEVQDEGGHTKQKNSHPHGSRDTTYTHLYGAEARPQKTEEVRKNNENSYSADSKPAKNEGYRDATYSHLYGAGTTPQKTEEQPSKEKTDSYGGASLGYHSHLETPHKPHVHPNGHICPGSLPAHAASIQAPTVAQPVDALNGESHGQGEESAPNSHILVVGSDGNIYGILSNSDALTGRAV